MEYTIQQLATLTGNTVRTLHHYDAIGLLSPARSSNGYRRYGEPELLKLQQIMFFRELEFPLKDITEILSNPDFDMVAALSEHRKLIEIKKKRMNDLLKTIDKTLTKITTQTPMDDKELYDGFSKEEIEAWDKEAKERWGHTKEYQTSVERYNKLTHEEKLQLKNDGTALMREIGAAIDNGEAPDSPHVQELVQRHYDSLLMFKEPNYKMYRNMADMFAGYTGDDRYKAYFEKFHPKLPEFMRDAIHAYCDAHE